MTKSKKIQSRIKKKMHIRKKIFGTTERPRMTVFKSNKHIYAQIVDDNNHKTVVSASDSKKSAKALPTGRHAKKVESASEVGKNIAKEALKKKIDTVIFDRNGFKYHGRVKALADAAREAGLKF